MTDVLFVVGTGSCNYLQAHILNNSGAALIRLAETPVQKTLQGFRKNNYRTFLCEAKKQGSAVLKKKNTEGQEEEEAGKPCKPKRLLCSNIVFITPQLAG